MDAVWSVVCNSQRVPNLHMVVFICRVINYMEGCEVKYFGCMGDKLTIEAVERALPALLILYCGNTFFFFFFFFLIKFIYLKKKKSFLTLWHLREINDG
jgi:hypothetical protein